MEQWKQDQLRQEREAQQAKAQRRYENEREHYQDQKNLEKELQREEEQKQKQFAAKGDTSNLYGDATFYTIPGHSFAKMAAPGHGFIGVPLGQGLAWDIRQFQGHAITFGATRSGKGVSSIIPALLSYGGSMVVIDPKGENAWATAERRRRMGHRVVILDPWGEVNRRYGAKAGVIEQTSRFNPLSAIDPESEDFADELAAVSDALIMSASGDNAHFTDSAKELVAGLTAAQIEAQPGRAHLGTVRDAITQDNEWLENLVKGIREANPDSLAARKLRRFAKASESKELGSVRSTAETQTSLLDSRRLVEAMRTDDPPFNLEDLARTRCTLYLVLPLDRLQTHGRWLRLILTMAIRAIAKQDTPPRAPVLFMLDEMGTIGSLKVVEQAFGLMAGVGIRIWAFLQDLPQLQRDYPESWETFISNASVVQALKIKDKTTSEYLSDLLGTKTIERVSVESYQARQANPGRKVAMMGDQSFPRPLLLPQEIRNKDPNQVVVMIDGRPYRTPRVVYHAPDSPWHSLYRPSPLHTASKAA